MFKKLLISFFLHCPNCEKGHISDGLFSIRKTCEVCHVVYERRSGESAGASAVWMMFLPILGLILFFTLFFINEDWGLPILLGVPLAFVIIVGALGYRHIRGLWIGVAYLTGAVYADEAPPAEEP